MKKLKVTFIFLCVYVLLIVAGKAQGGDYLNPRSDNLKWSQPPIEIDPCLAEVIYCGWDEPSFRDIDPLVCWECPTQCHGDADCDGFVDLNDYHIFEAAFATILGDPLYNSCADFDRDFDVGLFDWPILRDNFGTWVQPDCPSGPGPAGYRYSCLPVRQGNYPGANPEPVPPPGRYSPAPL